jgi:hypothetical protein
LIPGQGYGLMAGIMLTLFYTALYSARKYLSNKKGNTEKASEFVRLEKKLTPRTDMEISKELDYKNKNDKQQ